MAHKEHPERPFRALHHRAGGDKPNSRLEFASISVEKIPR
jgi:hypothetical protein